jgi:hypothetical protein
MNLKLVRKTYGKTFTKGKLFVNDGFQCYTIEDTDRKIESGGVKIQNVTAIPKGTYKVNISMSNHFGKFLPEILNVPQFEGVRIHSGNSSADTEGCIIVGSINDKDDIDWLSGSHVAFDALYPKMKKALSDGDTITLEIV